MRFFYKVLLVSAVLAPCPCFVGCSDVGPAMKTDDSAQKVQEDMTKMQQMLPQNPAEAKPQQPGGGAAPEAGK
jgi:hypothetical protein